MDVAANPYRLTPQDITFSRRKRHANMLETHAVGIDLGTTYSCISYLNEHGEPVTLANQEGELSTPSVVLFDGNDVIVGTEALRNAVANPDSVVQNSKRYMGNPNHRWTINEISYTPIDIARFILKKLLSAAADQIGPVEQAIVTVPAQFSEIQRQATVEAGLRAGLKRVDIINEPVAAALCYVLGTEGLWFTELADEQRIMVYDLGGGTFDLSLVRYQKNEVSVIASSGDLNLGGIDWNRALEKAICDQFTREFTDDPRSQRGSMQFLAIEVENAKRGLSVRPKTALTCQHATNRKTYQIEQGQFEKLTKHLTDRTCEITRRMLKDNSMGWAHVDVVLTTGGASRMPMIRSSLKDVSGRTLNTSLSPDQSIAHGATYYAGMLLSNSEYARSILNEEVSARLSQFKQQSVNARALGILVRNVKEKVRFPHDLIAANTPLPTAFTDTFGTVIANQKRVHLHIIESGTEPGQPYVELGTCVIDDLPPNLPENSQISVTIRYDEQARVHVEAKDVTSGKIATTEIVREENLVSQPTSDVSSGIDAEQTAWVAPSITKSAKPPAAVPAAVQPVTVSEDQDTIIPLKAVDEDPQHELIKEPKREVVKPKKLESDKAKGLEDAIQPVPLCNVCYEPLDHHGYCKKCQTPAKATATAKPSSVPTNKSRMSEAKPKAADSKVKRKRISKTSASRQKQKVKRAAQSTPPPPKTDEIIDLNDKEVRKAIEPAKATAKRKPKAKKASIKAPPLPPQLQEKSSKKRKRRGGTGDEGEEEFWQLVE